MPESTHYVGKPVMFDITLTTTPQQIVPPGARLGICVISNHALVVDCEVATSDGGDTLTIEGGGNATRGPDPYVIYGGGELWANAAPTTTARITGYYV